MIRQLYMLVGLGLSVALGSGVRAQEVTPVTPARAESTVPVVLRQVITVHLSHVPLRQALDSIAHLGQIRLGYSEEKIAADRLVSLDADHMSVGDALAAVLEGTGLSVYVTRGGWVTLEPSGGEASRAGLMSMQGTATLSGLVTDSGTGAIITQAVVHVDGTQLTTHTNATGHYTFSGLAAGEYRVTARHVGYLAKTRIVTLTDSGAKTVDFLLNQPATTLNEVVTTALGDMRRYQVGNVISTINADSIAPNAPVTSVTDLITGRAPGVEVMESSGMVGSGEDIRIRGVSSLLLQSDPIIIVDGVRVDNTAGNTTFGQAGYGFGDPYRLNDLDFNQIQTIDILKGPAATTEYGTDGANGVIVITTKRGISGRPQWTASATQMASTVPTNYPSVIWSWGHLTDGTATPLTNPTGTGSPCLVAAGVSTDFYNTQEEGGCVVDSVTSFNPLNTTATTPYGTGPYSRYDLSVGGGSDAWRYYFGGGLSNATGAYKLPDVYLGDARALGFPNSALRPNTEQQTSLTANTVLRASTAVDVLAGIHILQTYANFPNTYGLLFGETAALDDSTHNYGYGSATPSASYNELENSSPLASVLGNSASQNTSQWVGNATLNWRPVSWMSGNMTVGIDHETQEDLGLYYPQAALLQSDFTDTAGGGGISQQQVVRDQYTVRLQGTATATVFRYLRVTTTVGGSYVDQRDEAVYASASGLSASNFTIAGASNVIGSASQAANKSGGLYIEENLAVGDRCYAPLGLRFDVASGYGANVTGTQNPNLSLTCTILTGRTSLRLRGAYGISDQQPPFGANLLTYSVQSAQAAGASGSSTGYKFANPGNANLKPERDQEIEGGFDLGLWNGRVQATFTAYNKRAHDLLWTYGLGWEVEGSYTENVGNLRNEGLEGTVTANLIQSRPVVLGVTINGNVNHNKLLTLAPDLLTTSEGEDWVLFAAGYPLYGIWANPISYRDRNGDGVLEANEITFSQQPNPVYVGSSTPIENVSVAPSVGMWHNTVVINTLFDYEGDYKVSRASCIFATSMFCMPGADGLGEPLWSQALDVAQNTSGAFWGDEFLDGTYTSWRELSVAVNLPKGWARRARLQNVSVVGAVRNLGLWTRYPYGDPETSSGQSYTYNAASNSYTTINDVRLQRLGTVPLTRQWTLRLNAAF